MSVVKRHVCSQLPTTSQTDPNHDSQTSVHGVATGESIITCIFLGQMCASESAASKPNKRPVFVEGDDSQGTMLGEKNCG